MSRETLTLPRESWEPAMNDNRRGSGGFPAAQEKLATHASLIATDEGDTESTV